MQLLRGEHILHGFWSTDTFISDSASTRWFFNLYNVSNRHWMAMYQNRQMEWIHHSSSLQSMIKFISCYWTWIDLHIAWLALQMLLIIRQSRRSWMVSSIDSLMVFTVRCLYYTINFSPFLLMSFLASDDKYLLIHNTVKLSVESSFNCFPWSSSAKQHSESWSTWCTPYLGENLVKRRPFIHTVSEPQNAVSLIDPLSDNSHCLKPDDN